MATYTRTNTSALSWTNTTTAWTPSGAAPTTAADKALFNSTITATNTTTAATATVGQIEFANPSGATSVTAVTGQVITLSPAASFSGVGINFSSATGVTSFTISAALALASDQTWDFGSSAKTLTVGSTSNLLSGAFNLTLSGIGTFVSGVANTGLGGAGKTFKITGGIACLPTNVNALGSTSSAIDVGTNSFLDAYTITPAQNSLRASGIGTYSVSALPSTSRWYGAIRLASLGATKTLEFYGTQAAVSFYTAASFPGKLTGTVTDFIEFVCAVNTTVVSNAANDFVAPGGLRISSFNVATLASANIGYNVGATDAVAGGANETIVFGNVNNPVRVMPSGRLYASLSAGVTRTVSRNITFDGDPANTAIQNASASSSAVLAFAGDLTFSGAGGDVEVITGGSVVSFQKTISGTGGLRLPAASVTTVEFNSSTAGAFSSWSGTITGPNSATFAVVSHVAGYSTLTNVAISATNGIKLNNGTAGNITLAYASYNIGNTTAVNDFYFTASGVATSMSLGPGPVTMGDATDFVCQTANTTIILPGNITGKLGFGNGTGASTTATYVVSGTNTRSGTGGILWAAGNLSLNSNRALGNGSAALDNVVITATGTLDNSSGSAVTLTNGGVKQLNASFSWAGSNNLDLGAGTTTWNAARTFTFTGAGTGTLTVPTATTTTATLNLNIGGSTAGAKQRLALNGTNASLAGATVANQHAVTSGYFQINNNNGLGDAATTTTWWVGATNAGTQTTKAALELAGVTTPSTKNVNLYNIGPNDDGALIGVSGTSSFGGSIAVPNVAGTRIGVKAGATLTLPGSGIYPNLNPANASTPLSFTAESGGTLNQDRVLGANVGTVAVTGGSGTVVFSRANLHTAAMTCSAGTTKLTHVNAAGAGAGNSVTVSAGATMESTVKAVFPATLTLGSSPSTPTVFKVSV